MHVLVLASSYPLRKSDIGGVFYRSQVQALKKEGLQVGVVAPSFVSLKKVRSYLNRDFKRQRYFMDEGVPVFAQEFLAATKKFPFLNYFIWKYFGSRLVASYINKYGKPDVIHAHNTIYAGTLAVGLSKQLGIPCVITEHSSGYGRRAYKKWQLDLAARAIEGCDKFIVVSSFLAKSIMKCIGHKEDDWKIVPNVLSDRFVDFSVSEPVIRKEINFLNLGSLCKNKGQMELIEGFSILCKTHSNISLTIAGDGPLKTNLREKVTSLGLDNVVSFTGQVDHADVPKLMVECDALIVASHYETFGVVAIEAMSAGLPVLTTPCGGAQSVLIDGAGHVAAGFSAKDLAQMIRVYLEEGVVLSGREIRSRALDEYGPKNVAGKLISIYRECLQGVIR